MRAIMSLLMAIFAPLLVPIIVFQLGTAPTTELTIRMTRVMLLSPGADRDRQFLMVSGILDCVRERFAVP